MYIPSLSLFFSRWLPPCRLLQPPRALRLTQANGSGQRPPPRSDYRPAGDVEIGFSASLDETPIPPLRGGRVHSATLRLRLLGGNLHHRCRRPPLPRAFPGPPAVEGSTGNAGEVPMLQRLPDKPRTCPALGVLLPPLQKRRNVARGRKKNFRGVISREETC